MTPSHPTKRGLPMTPTLQLAPLAALTSVALTVTLLTVMLLTFTVAAPLEAQDEAAASSLSLEAVVVDPADPAVDTLCKLRVTIRNQGEQTVSQFGFDITINDVQLPVYTNQLFMYAVEAGASLEIPLYNFWSTETSRPAPADGKLHLEVRLREAQWMKIEMEDEVEVWTPLGAVEILPPQETLTLEMSE